MPIISKPMLAVQAESLETIKFPALISRKLDGIRCLVFNGEAKSRKLKDIPNNYIREYLALALEDIDATFDGELMVGDTFQSCSSGVMTESGQPDFIYNVFDVVFTNTKQSFYMRYEELSNIIQKLNDPRIKLVEHYLIKTKDELLQYEEQFLAEGHEGVMIRSFLGPYKCGRSTNKEGYLLKWKRHSTQEGVVLGFEERMHNENEAMIDELGHTKRSSHQENMVPTGMLGALVLQMEDGTTCKAGTGFLESQRIEIWENQDQYLGKLATIKYQNVGIKDKLRFPVFVGWRHSDDLSD